MTVPLPVSFRRYAAAALVLVLLPACGGGPEGPGLPPAAEREASWRGWQAQRDTLFRSAASPLPPAERAGFDGLDYFPYDSARTYAVALEPALEADTIRLSTTAGPPRPYVRYGAFAFGEGGRTYRLGVFKPVGPLAEGDRLFVPFTDATSGRATYGGGRYIDLEPEPSGRYVLDFNYAYNPYCVYDARYSCPLPPEENRLSVPLRAGELAYARE
ncbi:MAG: DUF1684 domain-containing protein [Rhodothermales bacterium]|nr:DUF1684 domain-containing protein [Rhodothermales bacterium]